MTIQFTAQDLETFGNASGDRNPLHLSVSYARATSFGQPVVFGALGALACLARIDTAKCCAIKSLSADFHRPMFVDVNYRLERSERHGSEVIRIFDGSTNVLTLKVDFGAAWSPVSHQSQASGVFATENAIRLTWADLEANKEVEGHYRSDGAATKLLLERFRLHDVPTPIVEAIFWSSYLVGMELPGECALFFRLVLDFEESMESAAGLHYSARVVSLNPAVHQIRIAGNLEANNRSLARASLTSFARQPLENVAPKSGLVIDEFPDRLAGKLALVLGASRGFGAAVSIAFARAGATVIGTSRAEFSGPEAVLGSGIEMVRLDTANLESLRELKSSIESRYGHLDYLVCNAFPPIPSLRLEENAFDRLRAYLSAGVDLVLAPLCAFLELLNRSEGTLVLISSSAVEDPIREWPHYVAAKTAGESLVRVAQLQYERIRTVVFRPNRMLTDMTNTPMGRAKAESPAHVAAELMHLLIPRDKEQHSAGQDPSAGQPVATVG